MPMNAFIATVMINGLSADYEVFLIGKKLKALLVQKHLAKYIPFQLDFWKEKGSWKSYHPLEQDVIDRFGSIFEEQLHQQQVKLFDKPSAA